MVSVVPGLSAFPNWNDPFSVRRFIAAVFDTRGEVLVVRYADRVAVLVNVLQPDAARSLRRGAVDVAAADVDDELVEAAGGESRGHADFSKLVGVAELERGECLPRLGKRHRLQEQLAAGEGAELPF